MLRYTIHSSIAVVTVLLSACGGYEAFDQGSIGQDLFYNDAETRRDPSAEETAWTVYTANCTASLLTDRYLLTAAHCTPYAGQRYRSGAAIVDQGEADIVAVSVAESSRAFDYAIVEIEWVAGGATIGQKFSPLIMTDRSQLVYGSDNEASELFTVGFPIDRRRAVTFAEGFAKHHNGRSLLYNIGTINGNSGGAVWEKHTRRLVSMTNAGPHAYLEPGWDNNHPEDRQAWNRGAAMDEVYKLSPILQSIFPDGVNRYVDSEGNFIGDQEEASAA